MKKTSCFISAIVFFVVLINNNLKVYAVATKSNLSSSVREKAGSKKGLLQKRKLQNLKIDVIPEESASFKDKLHQELELMLEHLNYYNSELGLVSELLETANIKDEIELEYKFYLNVLKKEINSLSYLRQKALDQLEDSNIMFLDNIQKLRDGFNQLKDMFEDYVIDMKKQAVIGNNF